MATPSGRTNMQCEGMNCSFSRRDIIKLDDFLNDLSEELAPPRRFISHANQVMDELFDRLKVDSNSVYHDNFAIYIGSSGGSRISPRRGHQLPGGGAPTYDFAIFSQKLHEIERIWAPRLAHIPRAPLDLVILIYLF